MVTYIVAADAARARVFARTAGKITEVESLVHPESRQHTGDLRTGGKGESSGGHGSLHQTGDDGATSDKHQAFFAKEVAQYLKQAANGGKFDELIIAAAPSFLGVLRDKLDKSVAKLVIETLDKDLSHESADQIKARFTGFRH
ncbi:host attachment protein [Cobetia crustatorum]|uniref:Host attachment protein n=1 Tax=Cobetia crustatorum TaxID=553385 RepID=A0A558HS94_9GAMM|nr:host attachment protein [Cobetia crustatorum]TVU72006.1 host attachment protein [Cobetia crustatorum]